MVVYYWNALRYVNFEGFYEILGLNKYELYEYTNGGRILRNTHFYKLRVAVGVFEDGKGVFKRGGLDTYNIWINEK